MTKSTKYFDVPVTQIDGVTPIIETTVKNVNGQQVVEENQVTIKKLVVEALTMNFNDEQHLTGEEKLKRYILAKRVYQGGDIDLNHEDCILINRLVGKAFSPLIVGQVAEITGQ